MSIQSVEKMAFISLFALVLSGEPAKAFAYETLLNCGTQGHEGSVLTDYYLSLNSQSGQYWLLDSSQKKTAELKIEKSDTTSTTFVRADWDFTYTVPGALLEKTVQDGTITEGGSKDIGGPTPEYCFVDKAKVN